MPLFYGLYMQANFFIAQTSHYYVFVDNLLEPYGFSNGQMQMSFHPRYRCLPFGRACDRSRLRLEPPGHCAGTERAFPTQMNQYNR